MLIIDETTYQIKMLGYIWDEQLLIEMHGLSRTEITNIFESAKSIVFVNSDGVKTDYSGLKVVDFLDGGEGELVVLK